MNKSKRTVASRPAKKGSPKQSAVSMPLTSVEDPEKKAWNQMYIITEHWQSDMDFFCDELVFLTNLIDKYFMSLLDEKSISGAQKTVKELSVLDNRQIDLVSKLVQHNKHLTGLMENPFSHSAQQCKEAHVELEKEISEFVQDFRSEKKKVFRLAETAIHSQKANRLLKGQ